MPLWGEVKALIDNLCADYQGDNTEIDEIDIKSDNLASITIDKARDANGAELDDQYSVFSI